MKHWVAHYPISLSTVASATCTDLQQTSISGMIICTLKQLTQRL